MAQPLRGWGDNFWHVVIVCTSRIESCTQPGVVLTAWLTHVVRSVSLDFGTMNECNIDEGFFFLFFFGSEGQIEG
jgi:hypothetical protein